jgi:hypothetical protein
LASPHTPNDFEIKILKKPQFVGRNKRSALRHPAARRGRSVSPRAARGLSAACAIGPFHRDVAAGIFPEDWAGELEAVGEFGEA